MGKVASSSVYLSLKSIAGIDAYHVHRLSPSNIEAVRQEHLRRGASPPDERNGLRIYNDVIKPRKTPTKIISLVREPISRNISAFFENLQSFEHASNAVVDSIDVLIQDFLGRYNHRVPLTWFDDEIRATTGINVYDYGFPHDRGFMILEVAPFSLLVMRHDLNDRRKEEILAEFLELDSFSLQRFNEADDKEYAVAYRDFVKSIKVPAEYADRMLNSTYARHFYNEDELISIRNKWVQGA
jgi:hypothetical protein